MVVGKHVRLFLVDGKVGGLMTAEIMNWTGHVLKGKRQALDRIRHERRESRRTGVYILLGDDPLTGGKLAYIGQSDDVGQRLARHDATKDFWNEVVVITSKDMNLTSAHVRYLEAELVMLAKRIGRIPLDNSNEPTGGASLPEAEQSDMNYFIEQLRIALPAIGVDLFRGRDTHPAAAQKQPASAPAQTISLPPSSDPDDSPVFHLNRPKISVTARAQVIDGEFTVLAGSLITAGMRESRRGLNASTRRAFERRGAQRKELLAKGTLVITGELAQLVHDVVFTSPSAAGAFVLGQASLNGREAWATVEGLPYKEWENPQTMEPTEL